MAILPGELHNPEYEESTFDTQLTELDKVYTAKELTPGQLLTKLTQWDLNIAKLPAGAAKTAIETKAQTLRDKAQTAYDAEQGIAPAEPDPEV